VPTQMHSVCCLAATKNQRNMSFTLLLLNGLVQSNIMYLAYSSGIVQLFSHCSQCTRGTKDLPNLTGCF